VSYVAYVFAEPIFWYVIIICFISFNQLDMYMAHVVDNSYVLDVIPLLICVPLHNDI
jgi:hypothetical protein